MALRVAMTNFAPEQVRGAILTDADGARLSDFLVDQSTPELFLENCVAGSSQYSLNAKYGKIWKRGGHFPMATFTSNGGSVVDY